MNDNYIKRIEEIVSDWERGLIDDDEKDAAVEKTVEEWSCDIVKAREFI